jgi:hypothetical protein
MPAVPLIIRSGTVALLDPALLPEEVVEDLAALGAIVIATAAPGVATVHLDDQEERILGLDRPTSPLPALGLVRDDVVDLATARTTRARDRVRAASAGAVSAIPVAATLSRLVLC